MSRFYWGKWVVTVTALMLVILLLFPSCARPAPTPAPAKAPTSSPAPSPSSKPVAKPIELSYNSGFAETAIGGKLQQGWCDEVNKRGTGRVKITFYPGSKLYGYEESERAIASGQLDMAQWAGIGMGLIVAMSGLPFLFENWDQVKKFHDQGGMEIITRGLANCKAKPLWAIPHSSCTAIFRQPVHKLADLKGLKLRSPSAPQNDYLVSLGASVASVGTGEVYQALQLGTIDGVYSSTASLYARKWYEAARYFVDNPTAIYTHYCVINTDKWNGLPDDIKNIMLDISKEWEQKLYGLIESDEMATINKLRGVTESYSLPPDELARWAEKARPVWDKWAGEGTQYAEAVKLGRKITGK